HPTIATLSRCIEQLQQSPAEAQLPELVPVPRTGTLPLSFAQQRLWFLDRLEPGNPAYSLVRAHYFAGRLHTRSLEKGLAEILRRHESLRTVFHERLGQPVQVIYPARPFHFPLIDLCGISEERRQDV